MRRTCAKDIDSRLDIAIQPALGSTTGGVKKSVVREALGSLGAGLLLGVAGSVAPRSVTAGQFYRA
jgi:hypothetical protein